MATTADIANKTFEGAIFIRGQDPQTLIDSVIRRNIYESRYWTLLQGNNAETLIDFEIVLNHIGVTYGPLGEPTLFLAILLKMLQIGIEPEIYKLYVRQSDLKYIRCLGALYLRLAEPPSSVYSILEPCLGDFRKIQVKDHSGALSTSTVDQFIADLLEQDSFFSISLPPLPSRATLNLPPRQPQVSSHLIDSFYNTVDSIPVLDSRGNPIRNIETIGLKTLCTLPTSKEKDQVPPSESSGKKKLKKKTKKRLLKLGLKT